MPAEPATHLLRDSLNNRLVELPAENRAICLDGDAVFHAVGDDVLLLAERVQLDNDSEGRSASATNNACAVVFVRLCTSIWFTAGFSYPAAANSSICGIPLIKQCEICVRFAIVSASESARRADEIVMMFTH